MGDAEAVPGGTFFSLLPTFPAISAISARPQSRQGQLHYECGLSMSLLG
jgi:hypothetical protein